jgi:DNA (cytosine-5)-methyltransferase 1
MKHGSLFSGIGGFDLAAEWMGWTNVFHCEWMEFPRKVLDYHFPNADSHIDICKTDFKKYANTIDILTGGFPCQPFSLAGKRKGTDDERYLWGEMLRAIQEIKPKFVIAENVFGITNIDGGLVFQQVCVDLENEGYEVQPFIIPAAAKNAPHRRDRCWFIAYTNCDDGRSTNRESGCEESKTNGKREQPIYSRTWTTSDEGITSDTISNGGQKYTGSVGCEIREEEIRRNQFANGTMHDGEKGDASNTNSNGFNERNGNDEINTSQGGEYALGDIGKSNGNGDVTDTNGIGSVQRNSSLIGKLSERNGFKTLCQPTNWQKFPTQPPVCGGDDGIPTQLDGITFSKWRAESIKGYGNAIVPQIAYQLFEIIQELNENN